MGTLPNDLCLRYLNDILGTLKSSNQHEKVLHLIVDRLVRGTGAQTCAVVLIDPKTEYLYIDNSSGLSHTFCNAFRRRITTTTVGRLLWTGTPILLTGTEEDDPRAMELQLEQPFRSLICAQIAVDQRTLGYVHLDSPQIGAFTPDDLALLQLFADLAGIAINKSRLHEENFRLERVDRETGLEKYVPFLEKLNAAVARATEIGEPFSILLLDVDNFKETVKTYGYDASRQLLREMAELVKANLRPIDAAARFGFDEYIILRENVDLEKGLAFATTLCETIGTAPYTEQKISSTVSIGVASYPRNGRTAESLILNAKKALFESQRAGRNKVFGFEADWYDTQTVRARNVQG